MLVVGVSTSSIASCGKPVKEGRMPMALPPPVAKYNPKRLFTWQSRHLFLSVGGETSCNFWDELRDARKWNTTTMRIPFHPRAHSTHRNLRRNHRLTGAHNSARYATFNAISTKKRVKMIPSSAFCVCKVSSWAGVSTQR
jgi:hypothetical protein